MKRRDFLTRVGGVMLAVPVAAHLVGCSDDGGTPPADAPPTPDAPPAADAPPVDAPPGTVCPNGVGITIGTNHGHAMEVPAADVEAGVEKTYQIQGTSAHPHTVLVTEAHYQMLAAGNSVVITSSNDAGHTHDVTLVCAA